MSGTVLLIQSDQQKRQLVHDQLEPRGHTVIDGGIGAMTHDLAITTRPDIVVVDSETASTLAERIVDEMITDERTANVPVIIANTNSITDLIIEIEVNMQMNRLRDERASEPGSEYCALTGLYNANRMRSELTHFSAVAQRYGQPLAIVLLGLDRFNKTNTLYGRRAGDEVLCDVAQRLSADVRQSDIAGRWVGDEFMAILPCTDKAGAGFLAERLRQTLAESLHKLPDGNAVSVTASFGCADMDSDDIVDSAQTALKSAKRTGRNAVAFG